jgi:hypothetical protein
VTVTREDGGTNEKTHKSKTSDESAQKAMRNTQLVEALEEARDNKMEVITRESLGDKLQRRNLSAKRRRGNEVDTEGEIAQAINDAELSRLEGTGREDKMAKLLIQMMWHLKSVARVRSHDALWEREEGKEGRYDTLTAQVSTKGDSQAIKAVLRQLKTGLKRADWKQWRERHKDVASVNALILELEHGRDEPNLTEGIFRAETAEEHFTRTNVEMKELYEMLTNDTAADGNKMAAIMEQKISIQEHFQKKDGQSNCILLVDVKGKSVYEDVHPSAVMGLIDEKWNIAIRKTCELEVDNTGVHVEDEDRITRMATYMMMVSVDRIKHDSEKVDLLFNYILQREPFYNIKPNNPPRFTGADFDYVRLKQGETPIAHQERRIPPAALVTVLGQIKEWMRQGVVEKSNSPHASPLLLVKRKASAPPILANGLPDPNYVAKLRWRTCVDYVQLDNKSEPKDISNAPRVDELLDFFGLAEPHKTKQPGGSIGCQRSISMQNFD